jgi:hypothetical protein
MSARLMSALASAVTDPSARAIASASCIIASSRAGRPSSSITDDSAMRAFAIANALRASSASRYAARLAASACGASLRLRWSTESW